MHTCTLQEVAIYHNPNCQTVPKAGSSVDWVDNKKTADMVLNIRQVAIKCTVNMYNAPNMYIAQLSKCIELISIDQRLR